MLLYILEHWKHKVVGKQKVSPHAKRHLMHLCCAISREGSGFKIILVQSPLLSPLLCCMCTVASCSKLHVSAGWHPLRHTQSTRTATSLFYISILLQNKQLKQFIFMSLWCSQTFWYKHKIPCQILQDIDWYWLQIFSVCPKTCFHNCKINTSKMNHTG